MGGRNIIFDRVSWRNSDTTCECHWQLGGPTPSSGTALHRMRQRPTPIATAKNKCHLNQKSGSPRAESRRLSRNDAEGNRRKQRKQSCSKFRLWVGVASGASRFSEASPNPKKAALARSSCLRFLCCLLFNCMDTAKP